ncbi:DUF4347 domain-containing protein [Scytonema sp. NUACC26]|uniref:DUF4347 domain-containing protein n=1 Tax=Scytonema sp. NUACC26 TaxID=3140176 RepID=UPI0034DB9917
MKNILFIDSAVDNYEILLEGLLPEITAIVLEPNSDGVEQISQVFFQESLIQSVHIVSHGSPGTLYLGNSELSLHTLKNYSNQLQNWFSTSSHVPNLLLYGCNVAAGDVGEEFITKLHQLTGASIAATARPTGNVALGGNWNLKINVGGNVNSPLAFTAEAMAAYPAVLALFSLGSYTSTTSSSMISKVIVEGSYAYTVDSELGLQILDVTNPKKPTFKGKYKFSADSEVKGVAIKGKYAYVASYTSGLQVIDLTNPTNPAFKFSDSTSCTTVEDIAIKDNYAYVAGGISGLQIFDIGDSTKLTVKGKYQNAKGSIKNVTVKGNYAYVLSESSLISTLQIIDITNPDSPVLKGSYNTSSTAFEVKVEGNYAYIAGGYSGMQIIDVSDVTKPTFKGSFDTSYNVFGVSLVGNLVYIADGNMGVQVLDVSNPVDPKSVGTYQTTGMAKGVFVVNNQAYIAGGSTGLEILLNNTPPTATDTTISVDRDTVYAFAVKDFGFSDSDDDGGEGDDNDDGNEGTSFKEIQITELPLVGQFFKDTNDDGIQNEGEAITVDQKIALADISKLKFKSVAEASGTKYASFKFKVSDGLEYSATAYKATIDVKSVKDVIDDTDSGSTSGSINVKLSLKIVPNNLFLLGDASESGKLKLHIKLDGHKSKLVNELGVCVVDDDKGTIDGIALDAEGYAQAALSRAQVVFSSIANTPKGFSSDMTRLLEFKAGAKLKFFMIKDGTLDGVMSGKISFKNVLFADAKTQKTTDLGNGEFSLDWDELLEGAGADFQKLKVKIKASNEEIPLGTGLQGTSGGEVIDLREAKTEVKAEFTVHREAAFKNFVCFYQMADAKGGIDINGDGKADLMPGDEGYIKAAMNARVSGINLSVENQGSTTFSGVFQKGAIFAPMIIADGTAEMLLDSDTSNDPAVYLPFLGANPNKADHIRLLGSNCFGFEDLPGGGDNDFNDIVVKVNLKTA